MANEKQVSEKVVSDAVPEGFKVSEEIKSDVIPIKPGEDKAVKCHSNIQYKEMRDQFQGGRRLRPFIQVTDLGTGQVGVIIPSAVLETLFKSQGDTLPGRSFLIRSKGKGAKGYNDCQLFPLVQG